MIVRLQEAEQTLASAVTIQQVKLVLDLPAGQECLAELQRLGEARLSFTSSSSVTGPPFVARTAVQALPNVARTLQANVVADVARVGADEENGERGAAAPGVRRAGDQREPRQGLRRVQLAGSSGHGRARVGEGAVVKATHTISGLSGAGAEGRQ